MTARGRDVRRKLVAIGCYAVLATASGAAAQGIRTVTEADEPISIRTHIRHTTTVVLPATETIVDVVAGDGEYWDVSASANVAYVKPLAAASSSNVTLVAESGRVWALVMSESSDTDPDLVVYLDPPDMGPGTLARPVPPAFVAAAALAAHEAEQAAAAAELRVVDAAAAETLAAVRAEQDATAAAWRGEYPGRLEFPYRLEARARLDPFLVEGMWHDGRFTYLRSRAQETPTLFELTDGEPALVAYALYDDGLYVADHVLGPGRLVVGERWTEWGDRRPRPRQPWSMRLRIGAAAAIIGSAVAVFWVAGR